MQCAPGGSPPRHRSPSLDVLSGHGSKLLRQVILLLLSKNLGLHCSCRHFAALGAASPRLVVSSCVRALPSRYWICCFLIGDQEAGRASIDNRDRSSSPSPVGVVFGTLYQCADPRNNWQQRFRPQPAQPPAAACCGNEEAAFLLPSSAARRSTALLLSYRTSSSPHRSSSLRSAAARAQEKPARRFARPNAGCQ